jgi:predicted secreted protein
MTFEEEWIGIKPSLFYLKIFGCDVYVQTSEDKRKKLEYKNQKMHFNRYNDIVKAYRLYYTFLNFF